MLKPLVKRTLAEEIIISIKELIYTGKIKPGDKLPSERDMAEQLRVGRASVREALRALALTGILTIKPGDGTYLNENPSQIFSELLNSKLNLILQKNDFQQLMEARRILELQLVKLAAQRANPEIILTLEELVKQMESDYEDTELYIQEDVNFHLAISEAGGNYILFEAISTIRDLLTDAQRAMVKAVPSLIPRSLKQHRWIYECIRDNKPEEAARAMDEHMNTAQETLDEYLKLISS